jgi:membrane protease YdiL (CAAX protease family)
MNHKSRPEDKNQPAHAYDPRLGSPWWKHARSRFSTVGVALSVMLVVWFALSLAVSLSLKFALPALDIDAKHIPTWVNLLASNGPLYVIAMPIAVTILRKVPKLPTRRFSLDGKQFFALLIMCVPIMYAGSLVGIVLSSLLSGGTAVSNVSQLASSFDPLMAFVFMVLIAPVFEEWIFRKQIIDRLRRYGEKTAIVISALAFALFHGNLFQFFYAFGIGLVFAYVYMRTSRLRYSIAMHMIINCNGGVVAPWIMRQFDPKALESLQSAGAQMQSQSESLKQLESINQGSIAGLAGVTLYGLALLALVVAGIVLLIVWRKRFEFYITPEELLPGTRLRTVANPGMIAYGVLCVALMVGELFLHG